MDALIYARISADPTKKGSGVNSQLKQCRALAELRGLNVVGEYVDNDISAYSGVVRPEFERLLTDLERGKGKVIVTWHLDRLARQIKELRRVAEKVKSVGGEIFTVQGGSFSLDNASAEMYLNMLGVVAEFEASHGAERQVASRHDRAMRGKWGGGRQPFGYERDGSGGLKINEKEADYIRRWVKAIERGDSLLSIRRRAKERDPEMFDRLTVAGLKGRLTNPAIAGLVRHKGEIVGPASWPAIISPETLELLRVRLLDPRRQTHQGNERRWQGAGVYVCGKCGGKVHARDYKRNRGKVFYVCRNSDCVTIGQVATDDVIDRLVVAYLDNPENRHVLESRADDEANEFEALREQYRELVERKDSLAAMFGAGVIDAAQLRSGSEGIRVKLEVVERRLDSVREDSPVADLILSEGDTRERWDSLSADTRAAVIQALMTVTIMQAPPGPRVDVSERLVVKWK